jgi:FlaA1/EpsC-like NDP-sugar epimerase
VNDIFAIGLSRSVLMISAMLITIFVGLSKLWERSANYVKNRVENSSGKEKELKRIMIVGAGSGGSFVINHCAKNPTSRGVPVLVVDDDPQKLNLRILGVPILGNSKDIPELAKKHRIQEIVIAIMSSRISDMNTLIDLCKQTSCRVRILSSIQGAERLDTHQKLWLRDIEISDLLMRSEERFDLSITGDYLRGKTVLVTGGGGSIGSELCRQVMQFSPKLLVVFDIYENNAYELQCELMQKHNSSCRLKVLIGSIRDKERLEEVFSTCKPDVVFHAAAHKHVPLMEFSYGEAIKNNIFGTRNLLEVAEKYNTKRFVMLSTDKAVNPTNIMGATKRINEMMVQVFSNTSHMQCMMVRFGNVLGSHGSVVPLFVMQVKNGGPVTITHPDIVRYFMTIPEAAQLVLQAGAFSQNGAIFALDMGEPIRILDLAEKIIRFYGYEPNVDMPIKFTGLRPGEKLYEELLSDEERERLIATLHKKIFIVPTAQIDAKWFNERLNSLEKEFESGFAETAERKRVILSLIKELVPTYKPSVRNVEP